MDDNPRAWFWIVIGSGVHSSAAAAHVSAGDTNAAALLEAIGADPVAVLAAEQP
jgi:hypothetical protein